MKYQYIKVQSHRTQRELTVLGTDVNTLTQVTKFIKEKFGSVASFREIGNRVYSLTFRSLGKQDEGAAILVIEMLSSGCLIDHCGVDWDRL